MVNSGIGIGILSCGENNILKNSQKHQNKKVYVRYHENEQISLWKKSSIHMIFNGAHTIMGNWGKLDYRFKQLSEIYGLYLYSTNNTSSSWGKSALRIYSKGKLIADSSSVYKNKHNIKLDNESNLYRALIMDM